jgi:hypothetical protein
MQYSKARIYSPTLGRFLQTDPIGYEDTPSLYAYVLNDPANLVDPVGLEGWCGGLWARVCGHRLPQNPNEYIGFGGADSSHVPNPQDRRERDKVEKRLPSPKAKQSKTCQIAASEPGKILFAGGSATLAHGGGSVGGAAGLGVSATVTYTGIFWCKVGGE